MTLLRHPPAPTDLAPDADALIREARRLRRRRWVIGATLVALLTAAGAGFAATAGGRGRPPHAPTTGGETGATPTATLHRGVARVSIPYSLGFDTIFATSSGIELSGTTSLDGDEGVACVEASLDPDNLGLSHVLEPKCDDPLLDGAVVAPIVTVPKPDYSSARIARLHARTGAISLGPVLATYQDNSGSRLVWAFGPGVVWLYEAEAAHGPTAFEISERTGALLATARAPQLTRPLLAANRNGLYIAGAGSFGGIGDRLIYLVAPGATTARLVTTGPGSAPFVAWIIARGDDVWADVCDRPRTSSSGCDIWKWKGADLAPVFHVSDRGLTGVEVSGTASAGFFTEVQPEITSAEINSSTVSWKLVHVDAATGAATVLRSISLPPFWNGGSEHDTVYVDGSLYVLTPTGENGSGSGAVERIAL